MDDGFTPEVLDELERVAIDACEGDWHLGHSGTTTLDEAAEYVRKAVYHGADANLHLVFVGTPDDARTTALTGNGPTSEANAYFITTFQPRNVRLLINAIRERDKVIAKLRSNDDG